MFGFGLLVWWYLEFFDFSSGWFYVGNLGSVDCVLFGSYDLMLVVFFSGFGVYFVPVLGIGLVFSVGPDLVRRCV